MISSDTNLYWEVSVLDILNLLQYFSVITMNSSVGKGSALSGLVPKYSGLKNIMSKLTGFVHVF